MAGNSALPYKQKDPSKVTHTAKASRRLDKRAKESHTGAIGTEAQAKADSPSRSHYAR